MDPQETIEEYIRRVYVDQLRRLDEDLWIAIFRQDYDKLDRICIVREEEAQVGWVASKLD